MKRFYTLLLSILAIHASMLAQGWPANYGGVMLQGFYWDSYTASAWTNLEKKAGDLKSYIDLVWIPQSAYCGGTSMGYDDLYWFTNYNSSFGTESELRSLIQTYKNNGIGTIADVVINHRKTLTGWFDFPAETYNGTTYQLLSTDIAANDEGASQAVTEGVTLSTNNDTGENWDGMRDLDHYSANVQTNVEAYLDMLLNDFGYAGFRYDMVKGYGAGFTGIYNTSANPTYSVGEYWDGNVSAVQTWIDGTTVDGSIQSAAFDFPFRYTVRDAINNSNWATLNSSSTLAGNASYRRYGVTFVENHDTEYRSSTSQQDPITKDTLAANAYMLAMPGTPCIFYKHWLAYEDELKAMIDVRKQLGIHNQSTYSFQYTNTGYAGVNVAGDNGKLLAMVGTTANAQTVGAVWVKVLEGYHYLYYAHKDAEMAFVDKASGSYTGSNLSVKLVAASRTSDAKLVYTTDGTDPTATSTAVESGTSITIPTGETTLKVGLLIDSTVSGIITRTYNVAEEEPFTPYTITVYVNTDEVGWSDYVNYHSWGEHRTGTSWPGDRVTATTTMNGKTWFYKTYDITSADDYVSFVFSIGTSATASSNQTVDVTNVTKDAYFEISSTRTNGKYNVNDVTSDMTTGIESITTDQTTTTDDNAWYTLSGMRIDKPTQRGIYIRGGKKYVVK